MCCARLVSRPIDSPPDGVDALALALNAIAERDAVMAERDRKYTCLQSRKSTVVGFSWVAVSSVKL
jgi:hypothetical protein